LGYYAIEFSDTTSAFGPLRVETEAGSAQIEMSELEVPEFIGAKPRCKRRLIEQPVLQAALGEQPMDLVVGKGSTFLVGGGVKTAKHARQAAGEHVIEWNAGRLPSGICFYRLEVGGLVETRKLVLLK
jgi:hypothetical protein